MICTAQKGFLTLAACGNGASSACSQCGRPMCTAHLSPTTGFSTCYDCAATQPAKREEGTEEGEYDETWAHGYRSSYYSDSGYRPSSRSSYDSSDRSAFDDRHDDGFGDDQETGGFEAS
jgi:hypothetical protein